MAATDEALWAWNERTSGDPMNQGYGWLQIAHFDGDGQGTVCLGYSKGNGVHRLLTLDARGQQAVSLELPRTPARTSTSPTSTVMDATS